MNNQIIAKNASPFASIRHERADGSEVWSARELQPLLGYDTWRNFTESIERARVACDNSGQDSREHFVGASKTLKQPNQHGIFEREVLDYHLTRYACYLVAMNGDPRKAEIASAQTYFAVRTHQAEQLEAAQAAAPALAADPVLAQLETLMAVRRDQLALESRTQAIEQQLDRTPISFYADKEGVILKLCRQFGRLHPKGWSGAYRAFYEAFGTHEAPLARYNSLPACRFQEAVEWLQLQIRTFSAQRPLMNEAGD